ncbi:reticulon-2 isoform X3 [Dermochelys coriacea]|uniref:reticulon-2 isoform X3 n=1 Tax=Dermochelys coriacea TaxID=27794 RepID=UPI0018E7EB86|nr:reticulon-2 isoform X3 [Dermochelys coriacea]
MGQVLGFAHCKESPSTVSTTPDSTDGGNDESDFPELQTAREFSEDEDEETSLDWGTPRELTFSYITFAGGPDAIPPSEPSPRGRRDSLARRMRGPLPRPETSETLVPTLGDSLENIPSLCQSPEGEQGLLAGQCQGLEPFSAWDAPLSYADEPSSLGWEEPQVVPGGSEPCPRPFGAAEHPGALTAHSAEAAPETAPGDRPGPNALMPCPAGGTSGLAYAEGSQHPPQTWAEELEPQEEGEPGDMEPITEQQLDGLDQSGSTLGVYMIVADLVYWRDTRTSALVFTGIMVTLLSLLHFSIVSVGSYGALAVLGITITLRLGRKGLQALHRSDGANPFQAQLDADLPLSQEQLERLTVRLSRDILAAAHTLRRLFLVEDLVDSIKFAFLFYVLTYVGAVFNGLTLLILGVISAFTFPLLYRQHQAQIDQYVGLVRNHLSNLRAKIQAKLPSAKAKPE